MSVHAFLLLLFQFTLPCRVKALHFVNTPSFYPLIAKIVYPFLPKKIQNRIFFYAKKDGWTKLHSLISPDILLEQYGGKLKQEELIDYPAPDEPFAQEISQYIPALFTRQCFAYWDSVGSLKEAHTCVCVIKT
ncbi:hypothetical protein AVEN_93689-1 [Araneus ventricosus]|uniref:CRAL-TRIO domain-containing protein n=1 Tax=Araneus ventricosus TaxID=182803 RepID=A0A4Y2I5G5_ARAVE|nr:hypothetical protein AVEN_60732-1 [Araneus ventricosus]GBM72469.1 hypothetical protein AVEN_93689-1 [Araneus ventricosus]